MPAKVTKINYYRMLYSLVLRNNIQTTQENHVSFIYQTTYQSNPYAACAATPA